MASHTYWSNIDTWHLVWLFVMQLQPNTSTMYTQCLEEVWTQFNNIYVERIPIKDLVGECLLE